MSRRYTVTLSRPTYEYAHVEVVADSAETAETAALALSEAGEVDNWEASTEPGDRNEVQAIGCEVDDDQEPEPAS